MVKLMIKPCQTLLLKKAPKKGREKEKGARAKVQASKEPNKGGPQGEKGTTKN
jgi:hypothetical protein